MAISNIFLDELEKNIDKFDIINTKFDNFVKNTNQRQLDKIQKIVNLINSLEPKMNKLADEEFPKKTLELKEKLKLGENIDNLAIKGNDRLLTRLIDNRGQPYTILSK